MIWAFGAEAYLVMSLVAELTYLFEHEITNVSDL